MIVVMMDPNLPATGFLAQSRRFLNRQFLRFVTWATHRFSHNPTRKWKRTPGLELVLDLDSNTFCGVGFGKPYSELSFLGPCDEYAGMNVECVDEDGNSLGKPEMSYDLSYNTDGFGIGADSGRGVTHFLIQLIPFPEEPYVLRKSQDRAYCGTIRLNGQTLDRSVLRSVDSVRQHFGAPDEDNETPAHDAEIEGHTVPQGHVRMLVYMRPNATWMFFVDEAENVRTMYLNPPMPNRRASCDGPECDDRGC